MFPYRAVVEWSEEDECFIARAPAFETLATHGDTAEAALRELGVAGPLMIEAMKAHGRTVPEPDASVADFAGKVALRIPRSMHARVALVASAEGVSINQLLVSLISEGLGRQAPRPIDAKARNRVKAASRALRAVAAARSRVKAKAIPAATRKPAPRSTTKEHAAR